MHIHIHMQTLAGLAHVHRNMMSRLAGSESVQKFLGDAPRIIRAATDISGDVQSTLLVSQCPLPIRNATATISRLETLGAI